jgi:hypothetical protein
MTQGTSESIAETAIPPFGPIRVTPDRQQYPELVQGVNKRFIGHPDAIYLINAADQIPAVVEKAVRDGKRIAVRSGGHCLESFVDNPEVRVVIDLSNLNKVYYDPRHNAVAVESGARLLDVYRMLYDVWGVTIPAGICFSVGAGGHVSGGGWGMLCRQRGLVIDHLFAVEVVLVDKEGRARTVLATREADDPNRDIWWAHAGGGGGNFGVITRYLFRTPGAVGNDPSALLPKPPATVYLQAVSWSWSDMTQQRFTRLVQNYGGWFAEHSSPHDPYRALASFLVVNHQSNGAIGMVTQVDGTVPNAQQMLADYMAVITGGLDVTHRPMTKRMGEFNAMPHLAQPRHLPWLEATKFIALTNSSLTDPTLRAKYKSAYMRKNVPDEQAAVMYKHFSSTDVSVPGASVTFSSFGGEINAVAPDATSYPHRTSAFKMMWMSLWIDPAEDDKYIGWNRDFYQDLYKDTGGVPVPNAVTDGCYANYPDVDLSDPRFNRSQSPWHDLYYVHNYRRLQQIKARLDPRDAFRHAQSIRLPGA